MKKIKCIIAIGIAAVLSVLPAGACFADDAGDRMMGDVDGNGVVNLEDAQLVLLDALSIASIDSLYSMSADIDGNGVINLEDANLTLKMALGISINEDNNNNNDDDNDNADVKRLVDYINNNYDGVDSQGKKYISLEEVSSKDSDCLQIAFDAQDNELDIYYVDVTSSITVGTGWSYSIDSGSIAKSFAVFIITYHNEQASAVTYFDLGYKTSDTLYFEFYENELNLSTMPGSTLQNLANNTLSLSVLKVKRLLLERGFSIDMLGFYNL